jgi:hypothetical protein
LSVGPVARFEGLPGVGRRRVPDEALDNATDPSRPTRGCALLSATLAPTPGVGIHGDEDSSSDQLVD